MFVIYTRSIDQFCISVIEEKNTLSPHFQWSPWLKAAGFIDNEMDAIDLATAIQSQRKELGIHHHDIEVLPLLDDGRPDFKHPVFRLPAWRDVN